MPAKKTIKISRIEKRFYTLEIETIPLPDLDLCLNNPKLLAYNPFILIKPLFLANRKSELIAILQRLLSKLKFTDCINAEIIHTLIWHKDYSPANERFLFMPNMSFELKRLKLFLNQLDKHSMAEKKVLFLKKEMKAFLTEKLDWNVVSLLERLFRLKKEKFVIEKELPFLFSDEYLQKLSVVECLEFNNRYPRDELERKIVMYSTFYDYFIERDIIIKNLGNKKFIKELLVKRNVREYLRFIPNWKKMVDDNVAVTQKLEREVWRFELIKKELNLKRALKQDSMFFTFIRNKKKKR